MATAPKKTPAAVKKTLGRKLPGTGATEAQDQTMFDQLLQQFQGLRDELKALGIETALLRTMNGEVDGALRLLNTAITDQNVILKQVIEEAAAKKGKTKEKNLVKELQQADAANGREIAAQQRAAQQAAEELVKASAASTAAVISQAKPTEPPPAKPAAAPVTMDTLRTKFLAHVQDKGRESGIEKLKVYGVQRLTELPEKDWAAFSSLLDATAKPAAPASPSEGLI